MIKQMIKNFVSFRNSKQWLLVAVLVSSIAWSMIKLLIASAPDPGHLWSQVGDGNFAVGTLNSDYVYTFPDVDATVLGAEHILTVPQGGTGTSSLVGIFVGHGTSPVTVTTSPATTLVGATSSASFSNKTFNLSDNNFVATGAVAGDLMLGRSRLARGTAGQVLRTNAAANGLEWSTALVPAGSDSWLQYGSSGLLAASSSLVWDQSKQALAVTGSLDLASSTLPSVTTGTMKIFGQLTSGRPMLAYRGDGSANYGAIQPSLFFRPISILSTGSQTTLTSLNGNMTNSFNAGTSFHLPSEATGLMFQIGTATTINSKAYLAETDATHYRGYGQTSGYFFFARVASGSSVSSVIYWVGLTSLASASMIVDSPDGNYVGFSFSTNVSDTDWMFETNYASSGLVSRTSAGSMTMTASKVYDLYFYTRPQASVVNWRVDNLTDGTTAEGSKTTDLPTASAAMRTVIGVQNLTGSSRFINFQKVYVEIPS